MNTIRNNNGNPYEHADFGRVVTAMVTPFNVDGSLNLSESANLAQFLVRNGSEGLVVAGTTGESSTLTPDEQIDLIETVYNAVDVPILAGTGSNNTQEACELTKEVAQKGIADGVLVVSPYYNRPPQFGIIDYFEKVSEVAGDLPMVMYDIPTRTGRAVETDTISHLASNLSNLIGVKLASGDIGQTASLHRSHPELQLYSGDDSLNLDHAEQGSVGAISVISHWAGTLMIEMYDALAGGQDDRAECIRSMLAGSCNYSSSNEAPNPLPAKAMMRLIGINVGYGRSPMVLSQKQEEDLEAFAKSILSTNLFRGIALPVL